MSSKIKGSPLGEPDAFVNIQHTLSDVPGALPTARVTSYLDEHVLGWMGLVALGAAVNRERRIGWAKVGVAALASHTAPVVLKRIVHRPRPHDRRIAIGIGTPSKLSFPSLHTTSMTAALVGIAKLGYLAVLAVGMPAIMLSRLVLGVHYSTDVAPGATLGAAIAFVVDKIGDKVIEPKKAQRNQGGQPPIAERNAL